MRPRPFNKIARRLRQMPDKVPQLMSTSPASTVKIFWAIAIGHLLLWTLICVITQPNLPLDMVEMIYWGQQWQWGYHKHPPLPAWTAAGLWELSGNQPWVMYFFAQLTIVTTFWSIWQLAREMVSPWLAICCVALMEGCYYCNYMINDINNTIMTRPMWALAILFLYRALNRKTATQRTLYWCATGVVIGLGMLCKYYMAVLVITFLAVPVLIPDTRRSLKTAGPWLMTAISIGIFVPHFLWMVNNDFVTIEYALRRSSEAAEHSVADNILSHLTSPLSFLLSQAGAVLPVVLLAWPLVKGWKINRLENVSSQNNARFDQKYIAIVVAGPVLVYLIVSAVLGASIRSMWGGPLFSFLGLFLVVTFSVQQTSDNVRRVIRTSLIVGAVMALALFIRNGFGPAVRGELSKVHFPGAEVARTVNQRWRQMHGTDLKNVGGQMFVAGCVGVYSDSHVDVYGGMIPEFNPWTSDQKMMQEGGMIVWDKEEYGDPPPEDWMSRFSTAEVLTPIICKSKALFGDLDAEVGVIVVHPAGKAKSTEVWESDTDPADAGRQ